jgi:intracellular septation protein A
LLPHALGLVKWLLYAVLAILVLVGTLLVASAVVSLAEQIRRGFDLLGKLFLENLPTGLAVFLGGSVTAFLFKIAESLIPDSKISQALWPIVFGVAVTLGTMLLKSEKAGKLRWVGVPLILLPAVAGLLLLSLTYAASKVTVLDGIAAALLIVLLLTAVVAASILGNGAKVPA